MMVTKVKKSRLPHIIEWATLHERLAIYLFPILFVVIEYILRALANLDTLTFIGPTLGAVGVGYVIPLTIAKKRTIDLDQGIIDALKQKGYDLPLPKREARFIGFCWVISLVFTGLWVYTLFLAVKVPNEIWWIFPHS